MSYTHVINPPRARNAPPPPTMDIDSCTPSIQNKVNKMMLQYLLCKEDRSSVEVLKCKPRLHHCDGLICSKTLPSTHISPRLFSWYRCKRADASVLRPVSEDVPSSSIRRTRLQNLASSQSRPCTLPSWLAWGNYFLYLKCIIKTVCQPCFKDK